MIELDEHGLSGPERKKALRAMVGAKPRFHKGRYGSQHDYHTCGKCGRTVDVTYNFCPGCGYRILWDNPRCLTGYKSGDGKIAEEDEDEREI